MAQGVLARRFGLGDAVLVGLGSMLGAGVFTTFGPAAAAAGGGLLLGLAVAAAVAWCNAGSSARLAAVHPEAGGAYVYGRHRLGEAWGHLAGWGFVVGKTASGAAMALTFGAYAWPGHARPLAVVAVVALTACTLAGIRRTALLNRVLVATVVACLAVGVVAAWSGGTAEVGRLAVGSTSVHGVLQAAGLLFFAFAGYARLATLGEEVREPERTVPLAIPLALALVLAAYLAVATALLAVLGPEGLARSVTPLPDAVAEGSWSGAEVVVAAGAAVASLGVLLSLLLGISRTTLAMAGSATSPPPSRPSTGGRSPAPPRWPWPGSSPESPPWPTSATPSASRPPASSPTTPSPTPAPDPRGQSGRPGPGRRRPCRVRGPRRQPAGDLAPVRPGGAGGRRRCQSPPRPPPGLLKWRGADPATMRSHPGNRAERRAPYLPGVTEGLWVDQERGVAGYGTRVLPLTAQEVAVLATLADARGRVVSRAELARRSGLRHASPRRADSLLVTLRRALGGAAVHTVRGRGWMLDPDAVIVAD